MTVATAKGKNVALKALADRRKRNEKKRRIDNSSLPAGSPMYFDCLSCNGDIVVPEGYISRPKLCDECGALKDLGWLE
jgi:transcription elongation factor Elf1